MTIHPDLQPSLNNFRSNLDKIRELLEFDELVLGFAITNLDRIRESQNRAKPPIENPRHRVDTVLKLLRNIRKNDSLAVHFNTVHNQALVLLVSHFAAALRDSYRATVALALSGTPPAKLLDEELKVTVADLAGAHGDAGLQIADLLIEKKDLSFQDMKGIARGFEELCGFAPARDSDVNDIIAAQACRHAIVHAGEIANTQTIRQLASARPRQLKASLAKGDHIQFDPGEVRLAAKGMERYLVSLLEGVSGALGSAA